MMSVHQTQKANYISVSKSYYSCFSKIHQKRLARIIFLVNIFISLKQNVYIYRRSNYLLAIVYFFLIIIFSVLLYQHLWPFD